MKIGYKPNWKNAHVQKRLRKVLTWAAGHLAGRANADRTLRLNAKGFQGKNGWVDGLNDLFGPKGNDLGDHLRARLLREVDHTYVPGQRSRSYALNSAAFHELLQHLEGPAIPGAQAAPAPAQVDALDLLVERHAAELESGDFKYRDISSRLWHPLQNMARSAKATFWFQHGLPFDYDIQACAPTILLQLAEREGVPAVLVSALHEYLDDRQGLRGHVADLVGISHDNAKRLINSLFNGARLGSNARFSNFALVHNDPILMERLKRDPRLAALQRAIRAVWSAIESGQRIRETGRTERFMAGAAVKKTLRTSKAKWNLYFQHERRVLDAIGDYCREQQIRVFTEHDGFRTDRKIDLPQLQAYILEKTGFRLQIESKNPES